MEFLLSLGVTLLAAALLFWGLVRLRNPIFRRDLDSSISLVEQVLTGQANEHEWDAFVEMPIRHDPELNELRLRCREINEIEGMQGKEFLLSMQGLAQVESVLQALYQLRSDRQQ